MFLSRESGGFEANIDDIMASVSHQKGLPDGKVKH